MSLGIHPVSTAETGYGNVRYTATMKYAACGDPLPSGKKASARYCDDDCRSAAARSRARNRAKRAKQIDSQSDGNDAPAEPRPAKQTRRLGSRIPRTNIGLPSGSLRLTIRSTFGFAMRRGIGFCGSVQMGNRFRQRPVQESRVCTFSSERQTMVRWGNFRLKRGSILQRRKQSLKTSQSG